jgi:hypothetical protein
VLVPRLRDRVSHEVAAVSHHFHGVMPIALIIFAVVVALVLGDRRVP